MHIILGLLGSIVTLLVILYRLADIGIDLGGLNPFAWQRRRGWRQKFEANPVFALSDPREIAAVLLAGLAKSDGDLSAGEKRALLAEFESSFSMTPKQASELLGSTVYLLGDLDVINNQIDDLLSRYREQLTPEQIASLLGMLDRIANTDGEPGPHQQALLATIRQALAGEANEHGTWG